ncbi:DUF3857 domain-containing protein [Danxiaibacter flavus]
MVVEIKSPSSAKISTRYAYTILNEEAVEYCEFDDYYDKLQDLGSISGTLYDATGKELKSVKKKDLQDLSLYGSGLMDDTRAKKHDFYYRTYPFTVEYEDEKNLNGIFNLPSWNPQPADDGIAVEYSKLVVIAPKDYVVRFKNINYNGTPVVTESGSKRVYTWEVKNVKAIQKEVYSPALRNIVTTVLLAPSEFEIEGYKGKMTSWLEFGQFINTLNAGRDVLPENIKQLVHSLTDNISSDREKVAVLYDYLQKNSRYISIQLGIGSWQPFDAQFVSAKKYGDCKALSNYMVALLKEGGIKANYVLIRALSNVRNMDVDFPSNQFNHATVCVPMGNDSIWLECTNQTVAEGYLGYHTDNRNALLIDAAGGHVVFTKKYSAEDNFQTRTIDAIIDKEGNLTATIAGTYACQSQDALSNLINNHSKKEQLEQLKTKFNLASYDVSSFEYTEVKQEKPLIKEKLTLQSSGYATVSGKRLFVTPNILARYVNSWKKDTARKYDIVVKYPFKDVDSIVLFIPEGYVIESAPKDKSLSTQFGTYEARYIFEGNKLIYIRKFHCKDGTFPAGDYNVLADFYNDISKADRSRIVFVKKE